MRAPTLFTLQLAVITARARIPHSSQEILASSIDTAEDDAFDWTGVEPAQSLNYTPCYDGFQCARLDVPLNWNGTDEEKENHRAAIAIVKLPARVPVTHPNYGGAILLNPGGPGESGTHQALAGGGFVQRILDAAAPPVTSSTTGDEDSAYDESTAKYFDIIGFDPRGVKYSTPSFTCFPNAFNQQVWLWTMTQYAELWDSDNALSAEWARWESLGRSCATEREGPNIMRYSNTAQVVEDMVAIVERHAQWREMEAERLIASSLVSLSRAHQSRIRSRTAWNKDLEQLQFWGVSYGSLLGQTFAAMHPDRVHRVAIDGIVDAIDYYNGTWLASLTDSDKAMTRLCEYCFEAGPDRCPLWEDTSPRHIQERVEGLIFDRIHDPIPLPATHLSIYGPDVITFTDMVLRAMGAMAFPTAYAESFFALLAELAQGNTTSIAQQKQASIHPIHLSRACQKGGPYSDACIIDAYVGILSATPSIECMDVAVQRHRSGAMPPWTKADYKTHMLELRNQSRYFSTSWARHKMACAGITDSPVWTYEGPITAHTRHPLLIIGNTVDTQTPIANAHRATHAFPGAVVLQQDSEGHCSYSNPSLCTAHHMRTYFQTGQLPVPGTMCKPEYRAFIGCVARDHEGKCRERSQEDEELWTALQGLTRGWP